ncbi:integrin alpha-PS2 [Copidosoma floridanum]|uniref:integrin alpha-PS2 n=1 Tax=Copidosoma floridanum TaxID=29053 RepID=UPI0006C9D716|nr:integrin alpha-PS2 [Copidosoma floridanum]
MPTMYQAGGRGHPGSSMWRLALAGYCCLLGVCAFNVETGHYTVHRGDVHSMFGYSVAEYRDQSHRGWVIVGAPLNQTSQPGVERGGAVFRCDIAEDNRCFPIEFDKKGADYVKVNKHPKRAEPIDDKSYQWFGATLSASMLDGGPLLACAPKYHWFGYIKANWSVAGFKDVVGACWLTSLTDGHSTQYSPCRNNDTAGHHRQGMCQAGIGAAITKDGRRLFIGAPGSWYWQGQLFTIESNVTLPFVPMKDSREGYPSSYEQSSLLATKEGPAHEDNNYLGYSVSVGDFLGDGDSGVAVGVPRASELLGKVLLFTSQLFNHRNITGEQMGAYFGYALAVNDIDGDDRDDLIVTAPFFTLPEFAGEKIETGRVYVFYQGGGVTPYQNFDSRDGSSNRGQFGLSVASLGDMDLDGYGDFVVGEPYGGPENRGAVYVYHGSKEGVEETYSQVIYSESLEQPVRTFGWSVGGGLDLDNNDYPDTVVGAYESNAVMYFRSRPVIKMFSEINFMSDSINLKDKACVLSDGTTVACSELKICCMYTGLGAWKQHDFTISISLDEKKRKNPRLFFLDFESKSTLNWTVPITKDQPYCKQTKVYVTQRLRDKLTSLDAEMSIELGKGGEHAAGSWKKRDPRRQLMAILGPKNTKKRDALTIQKNCGSDNVCVPDLSINVVRNVKKYLLGSGEILELNVAIKNNAEDAFESVFYMQLPVGIDFIKTDSESESSEIFIQCTAPSANSNNTLRCDVGNPLPEGKLVKFKVLLQPITFHGMRPSYELSMKVNSTNPERPETMGDNFFDVSIPVWIETDIFVEGESKPQEIDFNSVDFANVEPDLLMNNLEYAPSVTHNYTIRNNGPSTVLNIATSLIWTAETDANEVVLYLIEQPEISKEKVTCDTANADYLSIKGKSSRKTKRSALADLLGLQSLTSALFSSPSLEGGRPARQADDDDDEEEEEEDGEPAIFRGEPLCETAQCVDLKCHVGPLKKDEEVSISAKYRVNVTALRQLASQGSENVKLSTTMRALVESQPFIGKPTEPIMRSYKIETMVRPLKIINTPDSMPLWIWILAACIGILILLLLVYLLYKCGFFKRNRPSAAPECQPLNRS